MELENFICETLNAIINGVKNAQKKIEDEAGSAVINPPANGGRYNGDRDISTVNISAVLTVEDGKGTAAKGGIKVYSVELGKSSEKTKANTAVTSVSFSIPVALPVKNHAKENNTDNEAIGDKFPLH